MTDDKKKIRLYVAIAAVFIGLGIIFALRNRRKVVKFSEDLEGQTEIAGNMGFNSDGFQSMMEQVGWQPGDAWCVFFVKVVWYNMAPEWLKPKIMAKVTGSTWSTWQNLSADPSFVVSAIPKVGDMVIWRMYEGGSATDDGHAGVVKSLGMGTFTTIEGNTNDMGGAEGYIVAEKSHKIDYNNQNGFRIVGFLRFA